MLQMLCVLVHVCVCMCVCACVVSVVEETKIPVQACDGSRTVRPAEGSGAWPSD